MICYQKKAREQSQNVLTSKKLNHFRPRHTKYLSLLNTKYVTI